ncbi:MAG: hypothetical protein P9X26_01665 [Candidatus Stygibacter frigidus]|nr:hypothetical protein [Candidatus Stygibacter frigidus]
MRKVILLFVVMLFLASAYGFEKGTVNVGGNVSYSSVKAYSDADASSTFLFSAQTGYFLSDNITFDIGFDITIMDDEYDSVTLLGFDIGGRYFTDDMFYLGPKFMRQSMSYESTISAQYLQIGAGYLAPIVYNVVYLDLGVSYTFGIGEYGGDGFGDNEESMFSFGAGFEFFFKK